MGKGHFVPNRTNSNNIEYEKSIFRIDYIIGIFESFYFTTSERKI